LTSMNTEGTEAVEPSVIVTEAAASSVEACPLNTESTIRQVSVRIYRTLETDNRQDAASKGRAAGLIAKLPMHEAAIAS